MGNVPSCVAEEGPAAFIPSAHMASPFLEQVSQEREGKAIGDEGRNKHHNPNLKSCLIENKLGIPARGCPKILRFFNRMDVLEKMAGVTQVT